MKKNSLMLNVKRFWNAQIRFAQRTYWRKLLWGILLLPTMLQGQLCQGVIYGKIILKNGETYQRQLRWGNEKALWDDIFNASKNERPMRHLLSKEEARRIKRRTEEFKYGFMALWEDKNPNAHFAFRCYYGDIKKLTIRADNIVLLRLKNGKEISLRRNRGGDLDKKINVFDQQKGKVQFGFDRIHAIVFQDTPSNFNCPLGTPVYGKVSTTRGVFEGFITWDREECLSKDKITGKQKGTNVDLKFGNIKTLKAQRDGSMITMRSGRVLFLNDHDDVSNGNHGITVRGLYLGQVTIEWENFISVTFLEPQLPPPAYDYFKTPEILEGTVRLNNGTRYRGQIIYDLDEIYNVEFLNGDNGEYQYYIPFSFIQRIEPQNDKFSTVYLKEESQLLLGGNSDVDGGNHGIIVIKPSGRAEYIEWKDIKSIDFD